MEGISFSLLLREAFALLPILPWIFIIISAVIAYFFGWLWFGVWFKKKYMQLIQNKSKKTNWTAMVIQFLGLFTLAYLIGILSLFPGMLLLGTDALLGVILLLSLAGILFERGNTRDAVRFWLITAGYECAAVLIMLLIIGSSYYVI